jgi:FAD/FMN-containing dehydrogenase
VADAVKKLLSLNTPFAIRGGGHMPITGAANINSSGVLISNFGLKQLSVSADKTTVNVGPGNVWDDVYKFLEEYGLSVVGGRLGPIGVPGLVLGGGVSFFSSEYGWASANVASFTVSCPIDRII